MLFGLTLATAAAALAKSKDETMQIVAKPELGKEAVVAAGGEVFSYSKRFIVPAVQTNIDSRPSGWLGLGAQNIPAGTKLVIVSSNARLKACVPIANSVSTEGPCFLDDDGDGVFDRNALDQVKMATRLKQPVPYSPAELTFEGQDSFKRLVLYQGATSDTLRFSYREFSDDMARPAFTEELSIPREAFPSMIVVKNLQLEILGVTGMGLRYRVVKILP